MDGTKGFVWPKGGYVPGQNQSARLALGCDDCGVKDVTLVSYWLYQRGRALNNDLVLCPECARKVAASLVEDAELAERKHGR